ncbi:hypothetical protein BAN20980_01787 [Burkholderia anthina]|nr:hypothetical protein BAN20980_01787 [Burkholderia anthina]
MAALEVAFGWVAKGAMVLAGLAVVALMVLTGDASGVSGLPGTRKGWLYLLLVSIVVLALLFAFLYYWPAPAKASTAGG